MTQTPLQDLTVHHEESDVDIRAIFRIGAALTMLIVVTALLVGLLFLLLNRREEARTRTQFPLAVGQELRLPPAPHLQVAPRQDLQDLRARDTRMLDGYEWVDRDAGTVRIPIAEAMRLLVERGFPVRPPPEQDAP
jgi:hypothetical protein